MALRRLTESGKTGISSVVSSETVRKDADVQHRLVRVFGLIIFAFLLLAGWQSYWQLYRSNWLLARRENKRLARVEANTPRGAIFDRRGVRLAWSAGGARHYADPVATAAVLGYLDPRYGRVGVEGEWDAELAGLAARFDARELQRIIAGKKPHGKDLVLTLDLALQQQALRALGDRRGAAVMLDPATGAILALASSPTFDASKIGDTFPALRQRSDGVLGNRATQGLYPPGSTMKVVTAAAALMHGVDPDTRYTCRGKTNAGGTIITDYHGEAHGSIDMPRALAFSCNAYFANTAYALGQRDYYATATAFGFNQHWRNQLPDPRMLPLEVADSSLAGDLSRRLYTGEFVQMGFGQGTVVATPLQMAMVSATIAARGIEMAPYLVAQVRDGGTARPLTTFPSTPLRFDAPPIDADRADALAAMMRLVVRIGTASGKVTVPGLTVYGKTGTAEQNGGEDHAWFMGYAEQQRDPSRRVAFAVVVERAGRSGGAVAAPIARQLLTAWAGR